jgi:acyl-CoA thioesterase-1
MSFILATGSDQLARRLARQLARVGSYGWRQAFYQITVLCSLLFFAATTAPLAHGEMPIHVVALGDSLTAGYGLPAKDGFVPRLEAALAADGVRVVIANAGVSGDTASGGLARLDWSLPPGTDLVIVELGANDMLRGIDPQVTRDALDTILARGMMAAPNLGADYGRAFDRIYPELAAKYGVPLYPFFLDGVAADRTLTLPDGLHPNAAGVGVIVRGILPKAEELIARVRAQKQS